MSQAPTFRVLSGLNLKDAIRSDPPAFIRPMLATLVSEPFDASQWLFEPKWDGLRAIAHGGKEPIRLYSRTLRSYVDSYPGIAAALARLPAEVVLDGEIVTQGESVYHVFDLLYLGGYDLTVLPLFRRKELLARLLEAAEGLTAIRETPYVLEEGKNFFEQEKKKNREGIVAKDTMSLYRPGGRTHEWLKIKTHLRQQAVICGFIESRGRLSTLVLGVYEGEELRFSGLLSKGISGFISNELSQKLHALGPASCPFRIVPFFRERITWVHPNLVCEVNFREWTDEGLMRSPSFAGLRMEKPAQAVVREDPEMTILALRQELSEKESPPHSNIEVVHPRHLHLLDDNPTLP